MAYVTKKTVKGRTYYYLAHTVRKGGKVEKKERYLGASVPKDAEKRISAFLYEIYSEKWFGDLDKIKEGYSREQKALPPSAAKKELESFSVRFTYDSQRIEGSTLTLRETAQLLEENISPKNKPLQDAKEAEAHQKVFFEMLESKKDLSLNDALYWHKMLFQDTKPDIAGKIRAHQVMISGSRFVPPSPVEVYPMLTEFFRWYEKSKGKLHPVEMAALVHLKFVTIHPFADGNGRMSRLMMNFVLNRSGFPMLNVPYENRSGYYTALERAQVKGQEFIFVNWFFRKYIKEFGRLAKKK
ncbi:MAG: Fic family protein [Candidatus Thermoplasmatota archaeon]|nr:Fic family protein [Candidatus Thermoplasmatota archaeon]